MDARGFLDDAGAKLVAGAVERAEKRTAAEVVCAVATESGRYDRAEAVAGLVFGLIGLAAADAAWSAWSGPGSWGGATPIAAQAAGVVLGFVVGSIVATHSLTLRRALVGRREMVEETERAAAAVFARSRVGATSRRTGVLVYVSLFERRVVVLLDDAARAAASEGFAERLCAQAVAGLARGGRGDVLASLVDAVADELASKLAPVPRDADELPNRVIVLHPR
jgi:putative membrane protein